MELNIGIDMRIVDTNTVKEAVYKLCVQANTSYNSALYNIIAKRYKYSQSPKDALLLKNIQIAFSSKRPLCQDTGQVIVFVKTGMGVKYEGVFIDKTINEAVEQAYGENYFRKSVVKDAINDRNNTETNTPAIIYHEFTEGDSIKIDMLIKGAGAENLSKIKMFKPTDEKQTIFEFIKQTINNAGEKACPPFVIGVGIGGTMDKAALLSKKAFFEQGDSALNKELSEYLDKELPGDNNCAMPAGVYPELVSKAGMTTTDILDLNVITTSTHIASLPVAVTINCHSTRHAGCSIEGENIIYKENNIDFIDIVETDKGISINTDEVEKIRSLKEGDEILLTGTIYTARDAAHKRMSEMIKNNETLPFDLKDKIIFYAGPCPAAPGEVIGPVGPTTSTRMDKYAKEFYTKGLLASIGKGERSEEAVQEIQKAGGKYFTAIGGISAYLAQKVKSAKLIAFEDLGPEGIYELYVENFPLKVEV